MDSALAGQLRRIEDHANSTAMPGRLVVPSGPFTALIDPSTELVWLNYAVPTAPLARSEAAAAVERLHLVFAERGRTLRFEFIEEIWPHLGPSLDASGLEVQARQPLMLCTPDDFRPMSDPKVRVQMLIATDDDEMLARFLAVRDAGFAAHDAPAEPGSEQIDRLRRRLVESRERCALGWIDGAAAGVGSTLPLGEIAELAGVATLPALRRRGVAATVSSHLVREHIERGGTLVWLSAGDAVAEAVYRRIGFRTVATRLNYIARS